MSTLVFICPYCDAQDEVADIHATSIHRCGACGLPVPTDTIEQHVTPAPDVEVVPIQEPSRPAGPLPPVDLAIPVPSTRSIDNLREKIQLLTRQHDGAGERLSLMLQEYQQLKQQLDRVTTQLQQQRDDDLREQEHMQSLEQALDQLTAQVEHREQEDREQRDRIQILEQERASLERAREEAGERHAQEMAETRERMQAALRQRDELRIDIEGLQLQRDQWLGEIDTKSRVIDALEEQTASLQAELRTAHQLQEQVEAYEEQVARQEREYRELDAQLTIARSALRDAEGVVATLQSLQDELGRLARSSLETRQENQRIREENTLLRHELLDELQRIQSAFYSGAPPPQQQLIDLRQRIEDALGEGDGGGHRTSNIEHRSEAPLPLPSMFSVRCSKPASPLSHVTTRRTPLGTWDR